MPDFPCSLIDFQHRFPDEAACAAWLFEARWPAGFRCPACAHEKGWPHGGKRFTFECAACGKQTSVTAGTILHGSKLSLSLWFWATYLMATHSNGISALQLQSQLGLGSYKSAWLLCAKLRRAMVAPSRALLSGVAEVDETELPCARRTIRSQAAAVAADKAKCSSPARSRSPMAARDAFVSRKSPTSPPNRCTASSSRTCRPARRSKPTDGPPIRVRRASLTTRMSSAKWPRMWCCPGFTASSRM